MPSFPGAVPRAGGAGALLSVAASVLFRVLSSPATALGAAQVWILRERSLRVAVWIERPVRHIALHLPQTFAWREAWRPLRVLGGVNLLRS